MRFYDVRMNRAENEFSRSIDEETGVKRAKERGGGRDHRMNTSAYAGWSGGRGGGDAAVARNQAGGYFDSLREDFHDSAKDVDREPERYLNSVGRRRLQAALAPLAFPPQPHHYDRHKEYWLRAIVWWLNEKPVLARSSQRLTSRLSTNDLHLEHQCSCMCR